MAKSKLTTRSEVEQLHKALSDLASFEVLVGFPQETKNRQSDEEGMPPTNAALAYIHDNGMPEQNIPARPFMLPAMQEVRQQLGKNLVQGAKLGVRYKLADAGMVGMVRAGTVAELAIKRKINEGIPPPLSEATLRQRAAKGRQGAMWELAWRQAGAPATTELAKPLIDTAQMRNAVKFVIRKRKERSE